MIDSNITYINVPGYTNSGPVHWQSLWEQAHKNFIRVPQRDWDHPVCDEWVETLQKTIQSAQHPIVLIGHSLGSNTIVHWANRYHANIQGALLVTLDNPKAEAFPKELKGFDFLPMQFLSFKSILVCSNNDPYLSLEAAQVFSEYWGSKLINIGACGHINSASGLRDWPAGKILLKELLA